MDVHGPVSLECVLREAYMTMNYADMVIDCSDGSVPIHRHILAAASPFLTPILRDYNPIESHRIILPDIKMTTIKHVLSILYIGQTCTPSQTEYSEIVDAIRLLGIDFQCDPCKGGNKWDVSEVIVIMPPGPQEQPEETHSHSTLLDGSEVINGGYPDIDVVDEVVIIDDEVEMEHSEVEDMPQPTLEVEKIPARQNLPVRVKYESSASVSHLPQSNLIPTQTPDHHITKNSTLAHKQRLIKKPKAKPKAIHVTTSETAHVIQSMLESGQLCLAPGPALRKLAPKVSKKHQHQFYAPSSRTACEYSSRSETPRAKHGSKSVSTVLRHDYIEDPINATADDFYDDQSGSSSGREEWDEGFDAGSGSTETGEEIIDEDCSMTQEEILDHAKISSQKDHAYAHYDYKQKRAKKSPEFQLQKEPFANFNGEHVYTIIT